jgi:hypothetical protein
MALVSPPTNVGLTLKIGPDGSLVPCDIGSGAAGLGPGVVCVLNLDQNQPTGVVIQAIYANAGFPLPWARYALDWNAVKTAISTGVKTVCRHLLSFAHTCPPWCHLRVRA